MSAIELPAQRRPVNEHAVHLYDTEAALTGRVLPFLVPVLQRGDAALVVATPVHRSMFAEGLAAAGLDVEQLRHAGRYVELDAEVTLASFFAGGVVDAGAFRAGVGRLIRDLVRRYGPVHIYGEMVARLWGRGDADAAIALERTWNELAAQLPFRLLCAYPMSSVRSIGRLHQLEQMTATHTSTTWD